VAIGEQMREAALALQSRCGTPFTLFDRLTGVAPVDSLVTLLMRLAGRDAPARVKRQRSQLLDAMLDGHFHLGQVRVAIGAEPDLLAAVGHLLVEMGAELSVAVTTTKSPLLADLPAAEVVIGDLEDLEQGARAAGCDLLITHSHGRQAAERLGKPLLRLGLPLFDRIGNAHRRHIGYRGTRDLIFEIANLMMAQIAHHGPDHWPLPEASLAAAAPHPPVGVAQATGAAA
jgi:nitrogenase molybdenum-iron protein NifN